MTTRHHHIPAINMLIRSILLICVLLTSACVHLRHAPAEQTRTDGLPSRMDVLEGLRASSAALVNLRAAADIEVELPELRKPRRMHGSVAFQAPDGLHVRGNHITGRKIFEMRRVGDEWRLSLPSEKGLEEMRDGFEAPGLDFKVTPDLIAREFFIVEDWSLVHPEDIRLERGDIPGTVLLILPAMHGLVRTVRVRVDDWALERATLEKDGHILLDVTRSDFRAQDGALIPASIVAEMPQSLGRLCITLRNIRANQTPFDGAIFDKKTGAS